MSGVHDNGIDLNTDRADMTSENHHRVSSSFASGDHQVATSVERNPDEISVSSMPRSGRLSDGPTTSIPQTPTTEQPQLCSSRLSSHVFDGKGQGGWSMCSNESLFSISGRNTSFTKEQLNLMKSGELNYTYDPTKEQLNLMKSGELNYIYDPTKEQLNLMKSGELNYSYDPTMNQLNYMKSGELNTPSSNQTTTETTRGVSRESESQHRKDDDVPQEPSHSHSVSPYFVAKESQHHKDSVPHQELSLSPSLALPSDSSTKSFAFPILTGNELSRQSTKIKTQQSQSSSQTQPQVPSKIANETQTSPENPKVESPKETSESPEDQETPKEAIKSQTSKATKERGSSKWFGCFSCCSSGS